MSSTQSPLPVLPARRRVRSRRPGRIALRLCAWLTLAASLAGHAGADDSAGLQVRDFTGEWRDLVALESTVDLRVRGMVNRGTVRQRYLNDTGEWLEGRYLLPLPGDAAVDTLRIRVGDRLIEGEVQEKAQARATYDAAAARGQVAALVEQRRDNLFSTAVANIGPGEIVEVEIAWWQSARFEDGSFSLVLPLTFVPRYQTVVADPFAAMDAPAVVTAATPAAVDLETAWEPTVALAVDLDPGLPLASLTSPTHDIEVEPLAVGYRVRLAGWVERADRDFELRWTPRPSASPTQVVFAESLDDGHYAMVMIVPPTLPVAPVPRELVLVVDNSGSMSGTSMQQAAAAVDRALSRLRPDDRFNVIRFDHTFESVFEQSVPASEANVAVARRFVQALRASGGTELLAPLAQALSAPPVPGHLRQVVLITDAGIGSEQMVLDHIERHLGQARLFAVGIGSAPNEHFLRRAVELGRGSQVVVRALHLVDSQTDLLLARLDQPALRDLGLTWPAPAEVFPQRLPDLYVGEPLQVLAKLPALTGELRVQGNGRAQAWRTQVALAGARPAEGVGRLWARAKVAALEDELRRGGDEDVVRSTALPLALRHGLASRWTSLVAVERVPVRPAESDLASVAFANAAPAGTLALAQGATDARQRLAIALLLLFAAALALGRRRRPVADTGGEA